MNRNITRLNCKRGTIRLQTSHYTIANVARLLLLCLLASACSITNNLPEGEKLHRGIKSIDYDKGPGKEKTAEQEGVITALADAYTTVEGLLSGDASVLKTEDMSEKAFRDSMMRASEKDKLAY